MEKVIVTLRSAPSETVEVPKYQGGKKDEKPVERERSCFGALRFFPGIPKTVTKDELEFIKSNAPDLYRRLVPRPYVESKRVDKRGATEADVEKLAEAAGVGHLSMKRKVEILEKRGKLKRPEPKSAPRRSSPAAEEPKTATRKKNGDK